MPLWVFQSGRITFLVAGKVGVYEFDKAIQVLCRHLHEKLVNNGETIRARELDSPSHSADQSSRHNG